MEWKIPPDPIQPDMASSAAGIAGPLIDLPTCDLPQTPGVAFYVPGTDAAKSFDINTK